MEMICTQCGTVFDDSQIKRGGLGRAFLNLLPIILGLFFTLLLGILGLVLLIVGIALSVCMIIKGAKKACPGCGNSNTMIPVNSPKGKMLLSQMRKR